MAEFKNPTQGSGGKQDGQSFLVMIIVMFGVILGLRYWQGRNTPTPPDAPAVTQTAPAAPPTSAPSASATPAAAQNPAVPTVQAAAESSTVIENELYKITFSNRGAQVTSWVLKGQTNNEGQPLDLVDHTAANVLGFPLSLYTYEPGLNATLSQALYVPTATGTLQAPATVIFNYSFGNLVVHKTFTFGADYVIHADTEVLRDGVPLRALLTWPAAFGDMETATAYASAQVDRSSTGRDTHEAFKDVVGGATLAGPFDFAGTSDQYFAAIFMPDAPANASVVTLHHDLDIKEVTIPQPWYRFGSTAGLSTTDVKLATATAVKGYMRVPVVGAAVGDLSGHNLTRLFVGPKALPVLKSVRTTDGNDLHTVLDFGFWGKIYISQILYFGLHFVQEHIASNWGWAIILFTIFINLILLPLRVKGMKSMLIMQRHQPEIDAIKAKYGNPGPTSPKMAEMNAEVMAYQKEKGISMFGGCVPSLIQLPLLFAFFTMMTRVVELRHAHWGWLHDLSAADPYHILPILMVVTSFLVQFYTPSPGVDPQQQRMMAFMMPLFSGYMTWNYASALAIYWNVGNFIMIIQQAVMNRTPLGLELRELQAKRARAKTLGTPSSKTIQGRR